MTIDGGWVEIMKEESPEAFVKNCPFTPSVCYMDGMPSLMIPGSMKRWDEMVRFNFTSKLQKFLLMGAKTIVLAFDCYDHVPLAKSITQAKRAKVNTPIKFSSGDQLHLEIPENYKNCIANRAYKQKVIELVICEIKDYIRPYTDGTRLIIDYGDSPVEFTWHAQSRKWTRQPMTDMPSNGECDIKWTRWARLYGNCVALSVDGDFLPIALLEHERQVRELGRNADPVRIAVYRKEKKLKESKPAAGKSAKRHANGTLKIADGEAEDDENKRSSWEFVDITMLYHVLRSAMKQCAPSCVTNTRQEEHFMCILTFLIGICGTDFTRKVPHISPRKVWDMLPSKEIWPALMRVYDPSSNEINSAEACDLFIARLYIDKFRRHAKGNTLDAVLQSLQSSKLSNKTKGELPSTLRVEVTVRNCNFLLEYWMCKQPRKIQVDGQDEGAAPKWDYSHCFPNPVQDAYGFRGVKKEDGTMIVEWLDE